MEIVVDTVVVNHLMRLPKSRNILKKRNAPVSTILDNPIKQQHVVIGIDSQQGLTSEWMQTCGTEAIQVLITHWEALNAFKVIKKLPSLSYIFKKKLRLLGFTDTIDKLILQIALALNDKIVISSDSDFWDPQRPNDSNTRGNQNAPVARLCREEGITVSLLETFLKRCS